MLTSVTYRTNCSTGHPILLDSLIVDLLALGLDHRDIVVETIVVLFRNLGESPRGGHNFCRDLVCLVLTGRQALCQQRKVLWHLDCAKQGWVFFPEATTALCLVILGDKDWHVEDLFS